MRHATFSRLRIKMLPKKTQIGMTFLTQKIYDALGKLLQFYQSSDVFVTLMFNFSIYPSIFNQVLMWLKPVLLVTAKKETLPSLTQFARASNSHKYPHYFHEPVLLKSP